MDDIKDKKEVEPGAIPVPEKRASTGEHADPFFHERVKPVESQEKVENEKIISDELKREIELMDVDENLRKEAEQKANKIQFLAEDAKLEELLKIAREKGVLVAIQTAKKMGDPYILDTLHDILAKEGYYQKFVK